MNNVETRVINSKADARAYWEEEFGSPEYFSSFDELTDVEVKMADLQIEKDRIDREIKSRDTDHMNEYTINRAIELHFLIEVGSVYFEECIIQAGREEDAREHEFDDYEDRWREDSLFPREYED